MTDSPHPSGLPGAPWRRDQPFNVLIIGADGRLIGWASRRQGDGDAERIANAIPILPDLIVEVQRLIAADRAFEESAPDSADEKAALNQWNEISIDAVWKMGELLAQAGIPTPSLPDLPAALPPDPAPQPSTARAEPEQLSPQRPPVWDGAGEDIGERSLSLWPPMPRFRVDPIDPDESLLDINPGGSA